MKKLLLVSLVTFAIWEFANASCPRITPSFTVSQSPSCGVPRTLTLTNTSSGTSQNVATYIWRVNGVAIRTSVGKQNATYKITSYNNVSIRLIAIDTGSSPCRDSASSSVTVTAVAPAIRDGNGSYTYTPLWENCISLSGVPDTFGLNFKTNDTLHNYTIIWGDGTSNNTGTKLPWSSSIYHKYNNLGVFKVTVITTKNGCTDTVTGQVVNERQPVAGLIGPPTGSNQGCVPIRMRFINNSVNSSPSTTFEWDMGNGAKISLPSSSFKDTFYYTYRRSLCNGVVTLKATNSCGSSSSTWNPIQASSKDTAIIKPLNPTNCDTAVAFRFDNTSLNRFCGTPNTKKYKWIWGDGTNSGWITNTNTISKKFSQRGKYTVRLIDSNGCGLDTARYEVNIDTLPRVKFSATPRSGCSPLTASFDDNSTGTIDSRLWNFGDPGSGSANTSSFKTINHVYNTGGNFLVTLTVGNSCGNRTDSVRIRVKQKVKAGIGSIPGGCTPYVLNAVNTSVATFSSGTTYLWSFPDGSTSTNTTPPTKTFTTAGTYSVRLIATDSCGSDTITRSFTVISKPNFNFAIKTTAICQKSPVIYEYSAPTAGTFFWLYGDGTSLKSFPALANEVYQLSRTYDSAKTYYPLLFFQVASGCSDSQKIVLNVNPKPTPNFTANTYSGCGPLSVSFTNSSTPNIGTVAQMRYKWFFGSKTKTSTAKDTSYRFFAARTKDTTEIVQMIAQNSAGCTDSISKEVKIYPKPLSKFTFDVDSGCAPLRVNTINQSRPYDTGSIAIMKFRWNFANGRLAYSKDTQARFLASASKDTLYSVRLIAVSEHGCLDTSFENITVYPKPLARFTTSLNSGCKPLDINFNNTSIPRDTGSISIMTFKWDFGNKNTSTQSFPANRYQEKFDFDTIYSVRLIAASEHGCLDTTYRSVTLYPDPNLRFSPSISAGCGPLTVQFNNTTLNGSQFTWKMGDYGIDTNRNPRRVFQGQDIFDSLVFVELRATSIRGCKSDSLIQRITVYGNPVANYFTFKDTFCFPDKMQFFNQSLASYRYHWNLGDGTTTNATNPSHFFKKNSDPFSDTTYYISLIATSPNTCKDTFRGSMTVLPYPVPRFTVNTDKGCAPLDVTFTNQSINTLDQFWVLGDGYTSKSLNTTHTFINSGLNDTAYKATLYVYSLDCVDSISRWIQVYRPAYSFFRTDRVNPCDLGYFKFENLSENAPNILWRFGDGTQSNMSDPVHLFPTSPYRDTSFTVRLFSTSPRGCVDSFKRVVSLPQRLQMGMKDTSYRVCVPATIKFVNYTKGNITNIWDFGDNSGSSSYSPTKEYQKPGIYRYRLIAFDANGCVDSLVSNGTITAAESPVATFAYNPLDLRMPLNNRAYFINRSTSNLPPTYQWNFGDPNSSSNNSSAFEPYHDYSDSGNFLVRLVVSNGGCTDTAVVRLRVEPPYPVPNFTVDRDTGCPALIVNFTDLSTGSDRFTWFFGDGEVSEERNPRHIYRNSGFYNVILVAQGPGGIGKIEKKKFITVLNKPFGYFDAAPAEVYLPRAFFNVRNLTTNGENFWWDVYRTQSPNSILTSTLKDPVFKVFDTGYYDIRLISQSPEGCFDTLRRPKMVLVKSNGIIHVPSAFTPNRDGRNDVFKPEAINVQRDYYLFRIYNRWGQKVYETKNVEEGWDGFFNNKRCPLGIYVYQVNARLFNGDDVEYKGTVNLIR